MHFEKVPFAFSKPNQEPYLLWVGFDDRLSISLKAQYLIETGLGGAMFYSLDNDDYLKTCRRITEDFPLLRALNSEMGKFFEFPAPSKSVRYQNLMIEHTEKKIEERRNYYKTEYRIQTLNEATDNRNITYFQSNRNALEKPLN